MAHLRLRFRAFHWFIASVLLIGTAAAVSLPAPLRQSERPSTGLSAAPTRAASLPAASARAGQSDTAAGPASVADLALYADWTTFTTADGLPANKVFCIRADRDRVWAGTENGLAYYEKGVWHSYGVADGLPHQAVLSLDLDPRTGDLWVGTMGGLARLSGGRFEVFTQLNSGLSNDFVHAVACDPATGDVWAATAMGACRYSPRTRGWAVFTEQNTPMHEPWTYSVSVDRGRVYVGAWGGGILELDQQTGTWREYRDPDKEMDIDLLPDDGPIHDVTAGVAYRAGVLWQATYFGLSRYDGRHWQTYTKADSGLASDFINFVRAEGAVAWLCTDDGLSATDGARWVTYRRTDRGRTVVTTGPPANREQTLSGAGLAHNFILGVDWRSDELWVATARGVSRGRVAEQTPK